MTPFDKAVDFVLKHEGGYSNDPHDPGGETNFGISKRAYPHEDIKAMTAGRARQLYLRDYWDPLKCGYLPSPLALMVFDCAVNQGQPTAGYLLQEALGVKQDGVVGLVTIQAAQRSDIMKTLASLTALRCDRYAKAKNTGIYGKGWFRRTVECLITALQPL